jgi:hypothetical protein
VLLPVALVDRRDLDFASAPRRVNEPVVADVDAHMREREPARVEEDEITRLEVGLRDHTADAAQVLRRTRQRDAGHLLEHELDEPLQSRPDSGVAPPHL